MQKEATVTLSKRTINSVYDKLIHNHPDTQKPILLIKGGRGSGKSRAIAQRLVRLASRKRLRIALVRKVKDTIKESQWREMQIVAESWKIDHCVRFLVSPLEIRFPNGSLCIARGLDEPEKIKSLSEMDIIWIEEGVELTAKDWLVLSLSVRGRGLRQIIMSYNPSYGSWINDEFFDKQGSVLKPQRVYHLHTTFRDNQFRGEDFDLKLQELLEKDPELYKIHAEGMLVQLKGIIYPKFTIIDEFPPGIDYAYGVDPGFNDPFAVVKCGYKDGKLYWDQWMYQKGYTNSKAIEHLKSIGSELQKEWRIDDSEPATVQDFYDAGFNAKKAHKGQIKDGIIKIKTTDLYITRRSVNLLREIYLYKWKEDKQGNVLDEPVDFENHLLDAARYAAINLIAGTFDFYGDFVF